MFASFQGDDATFGRALEKTELEEVGFVVFFDGGRFVASEGGDGRETDRAVAVVFYHQFEHISVGGVETVLVDFHHLERR